MNDVNLRLGVIGCGGFGLFALQHFTQVPGVTLAGLAATHRPAALAAACRFDVNEVESIEKLVQRDDIDLCCDCRPSRPIIRADGDVGDSSSIHAENRPYNGYGWKRSHRPGADEPVRGERHGFTPSAAMVIGTHGSAAQELIYRSCRSGIAYKRKSRPLACISDRP